MSGLVHGHTLKWGACRAAEEDRMLDVYSESLMPHQARDLDRLSKLRSDPSKEVIPNDGLCDEGGLARQTPKKKIAILQFETITQWVMIYRTSDKGRPQIATLFTPPANTVTSTPVKLKTSRGTSWSRQSMFRAAKLAVVLCGPCSKRQIADVPAWFGRHRTRARNNQ